MVTTPDKKHASERKLSDSERRRILFDWNDTARDYPDRGWVIELFESKVNDHPEEVAIKFEDRQLNFSDLDIQSNRLAHKLAGLGVGPDVPVPICLERSIEMVVGILGILKAGGAYVPIDPTFPERRISLMIQECEAPVILTTGQCAPRVRAKAPVIHLDEVFQHDDDHLSHPLRVELTGQHAAYMFYTSGSTGQPKLTINTHAGIRNRILWMQEKFQLSNADRVLQKTPYTFDVSVWEFLLPLITGARLVMAKPGMHGDPSYLRSVIEKEKITVIHFVPSMLNVFLENVALRCCPSLRYVICSGEALTNELKDRFFALMDAALYNLYGPTEAAVDVTCFDCRQPVSGNGPYVPIGRPIANTQLYILDPEMNPVPLGVPGELYIGGIQVGRGYFGNPDLTDQKFVTEPFSGIEGRRLYRTGDQARWLETGDIEFIGRMDQQVKIRGFRIEPGEIEYALHQHPSVRQAAVVTRENRRGETELAAFVVCAEFASVSTFELRSHLQENLPEFMIPPTLKFLHALPVTVNGKIDRHRLPDSDDVDQSVEYLAPETPTEKRLGKIWCDLLLRNRVGVNEDFFVVGGHSLLTIELLRRISTEFMVTLSVSEIVSARTIREISLLIDSNNKNMEKSGERRSMSKRKLSEIILTLQVGNEDKYAPVFFLHPPIGSTGYIMNVVRHLNPDQPFYGIQSPGFCNTGAPFDDLGVMATHYIGAMREIQPSGDYYLMGHSSGGFIAYEMALQLQDENIDVPLLVVVDEAAPHPVPTGANPLMEIFKQENLGESPEALYFTAWAVSLAHDKPLSFTLNDLETCGKTERCELVSIFLKDAGFIPRQADVSMIDRILKMYACHSTAEEHYRNTLQQAKSRSLFRGKLLLFRCTEDTIYEGFGITAPADKSDCSGWDDFCNGVIDVIGIPSSNHITMIIDPLVENLASHLQTYLNQHTRKSANQ